MMSSGYGEKLKAVRSAEKLTQPELAELTGVSLGAIRNYETGQREVGLGVLDKIIKHPRFEKYALWLMTGKEMPEAGQISPALSPDGQKSTFNRQSGQKVG
ncbi:helix-turn-helix domain-containing protein [Serratia ureilytica]